MNLTLCGFECATSMACIKRVFFFFWGGGGVFIYFYYYFFMIDDEKLITYYACMHRYICSFFMISYMVI